MSNTPAHPVDDEGRYLAVKARDPRFDGLFFVGVTTTGVYCRPICPARTPGRDRCRFFRRATEAEREGFRACFRCRPELAPGAASVDARPRLVSAALARIEGGFLSDGPEGSGSLAALAAALGVSARHLRRAVAAELGASPVEIAQSRRLALAKQLLQDTRLPITQVAFAAGFASVRRFNALFAARFGRPPTALRRAGLRACSASAIADDHGAGAGPARRGAGAGSFALRLDYRPPLDWDALLAFLAGRATTGVESVAGGVYRRAVALEGRAGWIAVRPDPSRSALRAEASLSLAPVVLPLLQRLRALFDLDAQPAAVAEHLGADPLLRPLVRRRPGLRVPGAFDGFELAVRAVLGQQVSVAAATTLSGRLCARLGAPLPEAGPGALRFPTAAALGAASADEVAAVGLPRSRAATLVGLGRAVADGLDLSPGADPQATMAALQAIPGIGAWTAAYVALRALRFPDAFPAGDLALRRALGAGTSRAALERAEAFRPYRGYAALHLWTSLSQGG